MTPHRIEFWGFLTVITAGMFLLAWWWPVDDSDTSLRQEAAEVIGLIGGLLALLFWVLRQVALKLSGREASS